MILPRMFAVLDEEDFGGSFEQGIAEGHLRPVNLRVLRRILTAAFRQLLSGREDGISYAGELEAMMDILMNGIKEVSQ